MIRTLPIFRFPCVPFTPKFVRPLCSYSSPSSPARNPPLRNPKTPLFLRPSTHLVPVCDVQKWHDWAKTLASSVGSSFVDADNGPESSLLLRELKWLMEDTIEDPSLIHSHRTQPNSGNLRSRVTLDELYELWRQRIVERRPFQYVVGCEHWRDLVLCVEEGVLIPRPETETIVDIVTDLVARDEAFGEGVWADLGTGSGAVAIGIARILGSRGSVIATDLSPAAVTVAGFNVQRTKLR